MLRYENVYINGVEDYENYEMFVGDANEIEALYKRLKKDGSNWWLYPLYADNPKLNKDRQYGLVIDYLTERFHIVTKKVADALINGGCVKLCPELANVYSLNADNVRVCRIGTFKCGADGKISADGIAQLLSELEEDEVGIEVRTTKMFFGDSTVEVSRYFKKGGE